MSSLGQKMAVSYSTRRGINQRYICSHVAATLSRPTCPLQTDGEYKTYPQAIVTSASTALTSFHRTFLCHQSPVLFLFTRPPPNSLSFCLTNLTSLLFHQLSSIFQILSICRSLSQYTFSPSIFVPLLIFLTCTFVIFYTFSPLKISFVLKNIVHLLFPHPHPPLNLLSYISSKYY